MTKNWKGLFEIFYKPHIANIYCDLLHFFGIAHLIKIRIFCPCWWIILHMCHGSAADGSTFLLDGNGYDDWIITITCFLFLFDYFLQQCFWPRGSLPSSFSCLTFLYLYLLLSITDLPLHNAQMMNIIIMIILLHVILLTENLLIPWNSLPNCAIWLYIRAIKQ